MLQAGRIGIIEQNKNQSDCITEHEQDRYYPFNIYLTTEERIVPEGHSELHIIPRP